MVSKLRSSETVRWALFFCNFSCACALVLLFVQQVPAEEFESLFNGKDLSGWQGNLDYWTIHEGAIRGQTTPETPIKENTFLIWQGGKVSDFRLRLKYRIQGTNSGIQYRSRVIDPKGWVVSGYQADIDSKKSYSGMMYEEKGRGILARRGERLVIVSDGTRNVETFGDAEELQKKIDLTGWNEYVIDARGHVLRHSINGHLMSETVDSEEKKSSASGVLAFQLHRGNPMTIEFKDIRIKQFATQPALEKASIKSN